MGCGHHRPGSAITSSASHSTLSTSSMTRSDVNIRFCHLSFRSL